MKASCILSAAIVIGHLVIGSPGAVGQAATGVDLQLPQRFTSGVTLTQGGEPLDAVGDRMARLRQHRSILENALRPPRQPVPVQPTEPQTRALQPPEPLPSAQAQRRVSCEAAAQIVADYGFSDVRPSACSGELYRFSAVRDGTAYSIGITAAGGEIADVSRE